MIRSRKILFALGLLIAASAPACVARGSGSMAVSATPVVVYEEPPQPRVEAVVARPGFVYVKGRWDRRGGQWVWVDGHYERERSGYAWSEGRWERRGNQWHWIEGSWTTGTAESPNGNGGIVVQSARTRIRILPFSRIRRRSRRPIARRRRCGGERRWRCGERRRRRAGDPPITGASSGGGGGGGVTVDGRRRAAEPDVSDAGAAAADGEPGARAGFVWVSGRWAWANGKWDWEGGHWERERAGSVWVAGRWELGQLLRVDRGPLGSPLASSAWTRPRAC